MVCDIWLNFERCERLNHRRVLFALHLLVIAITRKQSARASTCRGSGFFRRVTDFLLCDRFFVVRRGTETDFQSWHTDAMPSQFFHRDHRVHGEAKEEDFSEAAVISVARYWRQDLGERCLETGTKAGSTVGMVRCCGRRGMRPTGRASSIWMLYECQTSARPGIDPLSCRGGMSRIVVRVVSRESFASVEESPAIPCLSDRPRNRR